MQKSYVYFKDDDDKEFNTSEMKRYVTRKQEPTTREKAARKRIYGTSS